MRVLRIVLGLLVCIPALFLPYHLRIFYLRAVAWLVHLPFFIFGSFAKWMLRKLEVENPYAG